MKIERDFFYDPNLVLFLPLYKLDGTSIKDESAYGRLCTVTGALWTPRGRDFDGIDDSIDCGSLAAYLTNQLTLEYWIKFDALVASFFHCGHVQLLLGGYDWGMYNTGGYAVTFYTCADAVDKSVALGVTLTTNTWYHLVGTYNGATMRGYANGVDGGSSTAQTGNLRNSGYTFIMGRSNDLEVDGMFGELRVYNRAFTPLEVQHNFLVTKWRYQ